MLVAAGALLVPLNALADDPPAAPSAVASKTCAMERAAMGTAAFKLLYGTNANRSNAYGKCVSKNASGARQDVANAAKACKAERAADAAAFAAKYGTNRKKSNAYCKCVSTPQRRPPASTRRRRARPRNRARTSWPPIGQRSRRSTGLGATPSASASRQWPRAASRAAHAVSAQERERRSAPLSDAAWKSAAPHDFPHYDLPRD